jgi:hypothetical protein
MKWDYMIAHYPKFNEWGIMRVDEDWWDIWRLDSNEEWTRDKKSAKRFYHQETAEWALALCRMRCLKEKELERPKEIKQSWGELSSS